MTGQNLHQRRCRCSTHKREQHGAGSHSLCSTAAVAAAAAAAAPATAVQPQRQLQQRLQSQDPAWQQQQHSSTATAAAAAAESGSHLAVCQVGTALPLELRCSQAAGVHVTAECTGRACQAAPQQAAQCRSCQQCRGAPACHPGCCRVAASHLPACLPCHPPPRHCHSRPVTCGCGVHAGGCALLRALHEGPCREGCSVAVALFGATCLGR